MRRILIASLAVVTACGTASAAPRAGARVAGVKLVSALDGTVSPDGRHVVFGPVLRVVDTTSGTVHNNPTPSIATPPQFAPDSTHYAFAASRWLTVESVDEGMDDNVNGVEGPFAWTGPHRISFVGRSGALFAVETAGSLPPPQPTGARLGSDPNVIASVAFSRDGRHVLYSARCAVWERRADGGAARRIARGRVATTELSFSSNGRLAALEGVEWTGCRSFYEFTIPQTDLVDLRTRRLLARLPGRVEAWSPNGRFLATGACPTGTMTAWSCGLWIYDTTLRRSTTVLAVRSCGARALLDDGTVFYCRMDGPGIRAPHDRPTYRRIYRARLVLAGR